MNFKNYIKQKVIKENNVKLLVLLYFHKILYLKYLKSWVFFILKDNRVLKINFMFKII